MYCFSFKNDIPVLRFKLIACLAVFFAVITASLTTSYCYPLNFKDSSGRDIVIRKEPAKVVSLVPSITEIICRIGAGDKLKAITHHSTYPPETAGKDIVGGFLRPDLDLAASYEPDIIFYNDIQNGVIEKFKDRDVILIDFETVSIEQSFRYIELIGEIFNKKENADSIIRENKKYIDLIKKKTSLIPPEKKKRVMRIMGSSGFMTPGDDSFQKEFITLAGGIAPVFNKKGSVVSINKEDLLRFNPQMIYGCDKDRAGGNALLTDPDLKDIEAVKNYNIQYYPCDLTCRAATNTGYFVSWLSAEIYSKEYGDKNRLVLPESVVKSKKIDIGLDYIKDANVYTTNLYDFTNKTLIIDFDRPINVISTLEGTRENIESIGNHYAPLSCWSVAHMEGLEGMRANVFKALGKTGENTSFLFTGADVDHVAVVKEKFRDLEVFAVVTAGVKSNAMRMSVDEGSYYEPGTINILVLPNMKITQRAMTRAIITATEAKTAALQDLDIRSAYSPGYQATGTGTDNMIIAQGIGDKPLDNTGGHTKLGELIASSVYKAVKEAVYKQNGIIAERNIFQRLRDRKITLGSSLISDKTECKTGKKQTACDLEKLLLKPEYSSFLSSSFSISDDYERGLVKDLTAFKKQCTYTAREISGNDVLETEELVEAENIPVVIKMALNALLNGLCNRK